MYKTLEEFLRIISTYPVPIATTLSNGWSPDDVSRIADEIANLAGYEIDNRVVFVTEPAPMVFVETGPCFVEEVIDTTAGLAVDLIETTGNIIVGTGEFVGEVFGSIVNGFDDP